MIVVDASVAVKWLLVEEGSAEALQLLSEERRLFAPSLMRVEVSGAVVRRYRQDKLSETDARSALGRWDDVVATGCVQFIPTDDLLGSAVELAFAMRHLVADCLYLAAGKQLRARVVTADRTLYDRGRQTFKQLTLLRAAAH